MYTPHLVFFGIVCLTFLTGWIVKNGLNRVMQGRKSEWGKLAKDVSINVRLKFVDVIWVVAFDSLQRIFKGSSDLF